MAKFVLYQDEEYFQFRWQLRDDRGNVLALAHTLEPTSALDPITTANIEDTLQELKKTYTIILAPHNTQQAARMADFAAFFLQGELIEYGPGPALFARPKDKRTQDYVEGRFG